MKITLAKTAGFCFGVNRAVNMLYDLVRDGVNVCTLGPIIHNPQVVADLENKGVNIIDDYAHHPTEIRASIDAARGLCRGRLICVFQSHTYSRTAVLFDEFVSALSLADAVVVAPIYAAREQNVSGVSEASLAEALSQRGVQALHGADFADTAQKLMTLLRENDLALIMGAGDIEKIYPHLIAGCQ